MSAHVHISKLTIASSYLGCAVAMAAISACWTLCLGHLSGLHVSAFVGGTVGIFIRGLKPHWFEGIKGSNPAISDSSRSFWIPALQMLRLNLRIGIAGVTACMTLFGCLYFVATIVVDGWDVASLSSPDYFLTGFAVVGAYVFVVLAINLAAALTIGGAWCGRGKALDIAISRAQSRQVPPGDCSPRAPTDPDVRD